MSITPLPDLPPVQEGLHLSALDSYLGQPGTLPGVSFWPRVGARVIDLVVHNLIALFSGLLIGILLAIGEGFHGSTPGKLLLSMVVVQEDGSPCRPGSAWIRSLAYIIDALFFGLIGYLNMQKSPQQQRHGDEWAHTVVCHRSKVAPQNLRGIGQFTLALFFAALADAALLIVGTVINLTT